MNVLFFMIYSLEFIIFGVGWVIVLSMLFVSGLFGYI